MDDLSNEKLLHPPGFVHHQSLGFSSIVFFHILSSFLSVFYARNESYCVMTLT